MPASQPDLRGIRQVRGGWQVRVTRNKVTRAASVPTLQEAQKLRDVWLSMNINDFRMLTTKGKTNPNSL